MGGGGSAACVFLGCGAKVSTKVIATSLFAAKVAVLLQ
jgi:hypothetical protein